MPGTHTQTHFSTVILFVLFDLNHSDGHADGHVSTLIDLLARSSVPLGARLALASHCAVTIAPIGAHLSRVELVSAEQCKSTS